jgi:hypothetical protein
LSDVKSERALTIPIGRNQLFTMRSNEGYTSFFEQAARFDPEYGIFTGAAHVIPDEPDGIPREPTINQGPDKPREPPAAPRTGQESDKLRESTDVAPDHIPFTDADFYEQVKDKPVETNFDVDDNPFVLEDPLVAMVKRKQSRFSTIHERLGHLSYARLKLMARAGLIPRDLANVDPPPCPGCAYGKAHRRPWRHKGIRNHKKLSTATAPGQVVSVDQLVSPTPGFVPTHRGRPTTARYIGVTVFADHFSDLTYVHLMTKMDAESTVEAKLAFERVSSSHGVTIRHYHSDNDLFDTKAFKNSISKAGQTLSFCGVNAHHQNGKAENRIKDVMTGGRTALLRAAHRWPEAIDASLWPAAVKYYTNFRNLLPTKYTHGEKAGSCKLPDTYEKSPLSHFSGNEVEVNLDHFHPFGSPVYVLKANLQSLKSHNKWEDRSRVGIYSCAIP